MLHLNKPAPDFRNIVACHKGEFTKVNLVDYKGKWLVLFFYPRDFTFVCPTELEEAAEHYKEFKKKFSFSNKCIFSIRNDIIKNKISVIYSIRSVIKSHSDNETFDRSKFLAETARFQLNEVMNTIILLDNLSQND